MVTMFVFQSGPNEETLYRTFHMCSHQITINLAKWIYRRLFKLANHKQEMHMAAILVA